MPSPDETLDITSALGDPTRYAIYRAIVDAAGDALTVAEVATRFSLHPNVARMHLQKLVDVGLVQVDTRKSKGGGRPARIYRLSERVASLHFPPRDYQLLAGVTLQVLQTLAAEQPDLLERVGSEIGREEGRKALRRDSLDPSTGDLETVLDSFRNTCVALGLFPRVERSADDTVNVEIRNCVFRELSARFPDLVCTLHTAMLRGILETYLEAFDLEAQPAICAGENSCLFSVTISAG
jgi:predicted ArsR family transcriptional regulator